MCILWITVLLERDCRIKHHYHKQQQQQQQQQQQHNNFFGYAYRGEFSRQDLTLTFSLPINIANIEPWGSKVHKVKFKRNAIQGDFASLQLLSLDWSLRFCMNSIWMFGSFSVSGLV